MADERVVLNVGGQRFEVSVATLTRLPDSLLGQMFDSENRANAKPDSNGEFFFDRNGRLFEIILDFYRTDEFHVPSGVSKEKVRREAEFWGLDVDQLGAESDEEGADDSEHERKGAAEDSDEEEEEEAPAPLRTKAKGKKVSLAAGVSVEEAVAFSKLSIQERFNQSLDLVHRRERPDILKGIAFLTNVCDEVKDDTQYAQMKADAFYYLAFANYRVGAVPKAKRALEVVLKAEPGSSRAKDLQILVEDSGASRAKSGFIFVAAVILGVATAWRLLSKRSVATPVVAKAVSE